MKIFIMEFNGTVLGELQYKDLEINMNLSQPSSWSATVNVDRNGVGLFNLHPYNRDFYMTTNETADSRITAAGVIMGGLLTELTVETFSEEATVGGMDWLHYLERRVYPGFDSGTPTPYNVTGEWVSRVIEDLFQMAASSNGITFDTSAITNMGGTTNYRIEPGDSETLWNKVSELLERHALDIWVLPTKKVHISATGYPFPFAPEYEWAHRKTIGSTISYRGVEATHVITLGAGLATNTRLWKQGNNSSFASFRRHDKIDDLGSVPFQDYVDTANANEVARSAPEIKDIIFTKEGGNFSDVYLPMGHPVWIQKYDFRSETIQNTEYKVISAVYRMENSRAPVVAEFQLDLASVF